MSILARFKALPKEDEFWLKSLVSAGLSGMGTGISAVVIAPQSFNPGTLAGLRNILMAGFVGGVVGVGNYLRQSPLVKQPCPPCPEEKQPVSK